MRAWDTSKITIRELTPELRDRLLDSFNTLHDYGKRAPWASREADFASSLLAFIPRAREDRSKDSEQKTKDDGRAKDDG